MAFVVPNFNLVCGLFTSGIGVGPPRLTPDCALVFGRRVHPAGGSAGGLGADFDAMCLLVPVGTDVRDELNATGADAVEVPLGTGRWYIVTFVDDIGKGYANEHRHATLIKTFGPGGAFWPTPIP